MEGTTTRVQDYIPDESVFFGNPEETKKTKRRNEVRFEIRVENGIDVVIERLTARTSKVLALIPSKGQYYVKADDYYQKLEEENLRMEMSATRFLELWGCIDPQIDVLAEKAYEGWNNRDIFTEYCTAYLKETNFKHNRSIFDFGRLLEYMADYPGKGFCSLSSLVDMWTNTLSMQKDVYGEVTDKYPDNLLTVHGVLSLKAGEIVNLRQAERFAETCEKNRFLEWENGEWVVLVPHAPQDMVEEAYSQNNCLRSYISAVAEGKKRIAFLRKAEEPEKSLITVEVYMNGHIGQVKGKNNREASAEERRAVSAWAKEKGLAYIEA